MNQYNDTTERIKRPQRVKKGQNAPIFFTFLMDVTKCGGIFAGLVATIGYLSQCQSVPASANKNNHPLREDDIRKKEVSCLVYRDI